MSLRASWKPQAHIYAACYTIIFRSIIKDAMLRHLKLPEHVVVARTIRNFGNNSAASIPIALDAMIASGEAKSGDTCLIIGFGAGLVYAGQVITIP